MAAIVETDFNICGEIPVYLHGTVATTGDFVLLDSHILAQSIFRETVSYR